MSETEIFNSTSWNGWKDVLTGHEQAVAAVISLREYTDSFLAELAAVREEWEAAKTNSQQIYDSDTARAYKQYEDERTRFTKECNANVVLTEHRINAVNTVMNACNNFADRLSGRGADSAVSAVRRVIPEVSSCQSKVSRAISDKVKAYQTLRDCQIAEAERVRNDKLDEARTEWINRDTLAEQRFDAKRKIIQEKGQENIRAVFNKATVRAYQREIPRFNAEKYECPTVVPDYIMLGNIGLLVPSRTKDEKTVVQALGLQTADIATKEDGNYIVEIPYAQRLSDGISLLMRYSPADRECVQDLIQPLLLKLFMSFPAGKLEATMIDPLELGGSFPDIPKLASSPNSARIIDTKIWSKEKDIETAIATLRQRVENMTQAYGDDGESRLKKEVIRALAITDFPIGFNDAALKDLQAVVRNSASRGVCVIICANDVELEKLKQKDGSLVAEIVQSVVETKAFGKRLMLLGNNRERVFLKIDEMADVFARKGVVLAKISSVIEHVPLKTEPFDGMFEGDIFDSNNWFTGSHEEIAIPIGIKGADIIVKMTLGKSGGSTERHALIAGQSGTGKSTLLHTLIMSTLISYSPDEVQMYLLDFKESVEFSAYTRYRLPSLRVVAINSEREFGLNVLKELCTELGSRTRHFIRYGVSDINGYVKLSDVPKVPKLLLIFDEVQELFRGRSESDVYSGASEHPARSM